MWALCHNKIVWFQRGKVSAQFRRSEVSTKELIPELSLKGAQLFVKPNGSIFNQREGESMGKSKDEDPFLWSFPGHHTSNGVNDRGQIGTSHTSWKAALPPASMIQLAGSEYQSMSPVQRH